MHKFAVSVLSFFVALPVMANTRLPAVNIAAGGVSARAAFGEVVQTPAVTVAPLPRDTSRDVATRRPTRTSAPRAATVANNSDSFAAASTDVLSPRRPSSDLWAHSGASVATRPNTNLRMPSPDEFAVYRTTTQLPEESLDTASASIASPELAMPSPTSMSEIDTQIARLNELQRRADNSVQIAPGPKPHYIASYDAPRAAAAPAVVERAAPTPVATTEPTLTRMVVPMDTTSRDVVVRAVEKSESPRIAAVRNDMTGLSPNELRRAFRKTFLSENKHLSTYQIDDRFDVVSDMSSSTEGFTARRDLSESGGIRPLEIKIKFRDEDSALSRDNYNLLTEYAGIVASNPTRAIQVSIPQSATQSNDARKLAARRLAIVEQVLRDNGISEHRIMPVLAQRDSGGFVLRMISVDQYETMTQQRQNMFGDTVGKKTYKSMSW